MGTSIESLIRNSILITRKRIAIIRAVLGMTLPLHIITIISTMMEMGMEENTTARGITTSMEININTTTNSIHTEEGTIKAVVTLLNMKVNNKKGENKIVWEEVNRLINQTEFKPMTTSTQRSSGGSIRNSRAITMAISNIWEIKDLMEVVMEIIIMKEAFRKVSSTTKTIEIEIEIATASMNPVK